MVASPNSSPVASRRRSGRSVRDPGWRPAVQRNRCYHPPIAELLQELNEPVVPCDHLVQVYRESYELAESVATYLVAGFEAGEAAVVVGTAAHWPLFADRLSRRGWDSDQLQADGLLLVADADEILGAILDEGWPSMPLFTKVVGALIDRAAPASVNGRVRVFGEMVDLLCRRGDDEAADALEGLWNRLAARKHFLLLCGYKVDVFDRDSQVDLLPRVYRSHSHVLPPVDSARLERALEAALSAVLGEADAKKVYGQVSRQVGDTPNPLAPAVLMWLSAHMPRAAERILDSARTHYLSAATS